MEQQDFITLIAEVLEVEPATVSLDDELDAIDWDSLSNISFIAEIDSTLGVSMDADLLADSKTVGDLFELVQRTVKGA